MCLTMPNIWALKNVPPVEFDPWGTPLPMQFFLWVSKEGFLFVLENKWKHISTYDSYLEVGKW